MISKDMKPSLSLAVRSGSNRQLQFEQRADRALDRWVLSFVLAAVVYFGQGLLEWNGYLVLRY